MQNDHGSHKPPLPVDPKLIEKLKLYRPTAKQSEFVRSTDRWVMMLPRYSYTNYAAVEVARQVVAAIDEDQEHA